MNLPLIFTYIAHSQISQMEIGGSSRWKDKYDIKSLHHQISLSLSLCKCRASPQICFKNKQKTIVQVVLHLHHVHEIVAQLQWSAHFPYLTMAYLLAQCPLPLINPFTMCWVKPLLKRFCNTCLLCNRKFWCSGCVANCKNYHKDWHELLEYLDTKVDVFFVMSWSEQGPVMVSLQFLFAHGCQGQTL